nr:hypothetical protein [Paenibacillus agricola]
MAASDRAAAGAADRRDGTRRWRVVGNREATQHINLSHPRLGQNLFFLFVGRCLDMI